LATQESRPSNRNHLVLLLVAFLGIFLYGLLSALPGSVLPTLERNQYLPTDKQVATFLFINAVGAVLAYLISGPLIDKVGKKLTLMAGTVLVIASMVGFALIVTQVGPAAALLLIFACSLMLGRSLLAQRRTEHPGYLFWLRPYDFAALSAASTKERWAGIGFLGTRRRGIHSSCADAHTKVPCSCESGVVSDR
jgi:MFS family permease